MSYIGNPPAEAYTNTVKDSFSGDGSTVAFTLSRPSLTNDVRVVVENVIQDPTVAYSVSGTTLTFTSAPPSGTNNIYVVHLGPAIQTAVPPSEISAATTFASNVTVQGAFTSRGIDDNATSTAMTLDGSGNLLVGTTSYNNDVAGIGLGASNFFYATRSGNIVGSFNRLSTDGPIVDFRKNGTQVASLTVDSGDNITFGATTNGGPGFYLTGAGGTDPFVLPMKEGSLSSGTVTLGDATRPFKNLYLSGGVYLGGTGAANYLDDYESGSWTPSYIPGSNSFSSITYDASRAGRYVKVGDIVHVAGFISTDALSIGSATGALSIDGLPFTVENSPSDVHLWSGSIGFVDTFAGDAPISTIARRNTTNMGLYYRTSVNGGSITLDVSDMSTASNANSIYFSVTYRTTA